MFQERGMDKNQERLSRFTSSRITSYKILFYMYLFLNYLTKSPESAQHSSISEVRSLKDLLSNFLFAKFHIISSTALVSDLIAMEQGDTPSKTLVLRNGTWLLD